MMEVVLREEAGSLENVIYSNIELVLQQKVERNGQLRLQDDLAFDSFRIITLLSNLSDELGVDIFDFEESDLKMESVGDLIRILSKHTTDKGA